MGTGERANLSDDALSDELMLWAGMADQAMNGVTVGDLAREAVRRWRESRAAPMITAQGGGRDLFVMYDGVIHRLSKTADGYLSSRESIP